MDQTHQDLPSTPNPQTFSLLQLSSLFKPFHLLQIFLLHLLHLLRKALKLVADDFVHPDLGLFDPVRELFKYGPQDFVELGAGIVFVCEFCESRFLRLRGELGIEGLDLGLEGGD
jgi:hypothetical protein